MAKKPKRFDLYNFFMVKGAEVVKSGGRFSFIIPQSWLVNE